MKTRDCIGRRKLAYKRNFYDVDSEGWWLWGGDITIGGGGGWKDKGRGKCRTPAWGQGTATKESENK